jgi:hypothetical protein
LYFASVPIIVLPALPVLAQAPIANQPRETLAQLKSPLAKIVEHPAPVRAERKVAKQVPATRMAEYRATPQPLPAGW